jgi:hypothetical protein
MTELSACVALNLSPGWLLNDDWPRNSKPIELTLRIIYFLSSSEPFGPAQRSKAAKRRLHEAMLQMNDVR